MSREGSIINQTNLVEPFSSPGTSAGCISAGEAAKSLIEPLNRIYLRLSRWLSDRKRQIAALPGNEILKQAALSMVRPPVEGARLGAGECIFEYQPTGGVRRYKICGITSGGFSNIYTAVDLEEMKVYCLKENRALPEDERRKNDLLRFEAEISLRLGRHPNLVFLESVFYRRNRLFLVYEYVPGLSLDLRLREKPLDKKTALKYAIDICRAMNYARRLIPGFVHGDIKPGNCLVTNSGQLKLADFGMATVEGAASEPHDKLPLAPARGTGKKNYRQGGTHAYMAPELFGDASDAADKTLADIYAFGVTLFEMFSGSRPFHGESYAELIEKHKNSALPINLLENCGAPSKVVKLISDCLAKNPSDRPKDFTGIEKQLRKVFREEFSEDLPDRSVKNSSADDARRAAAMLVLGIDTAEEIFRASRRRLLRDAGSAGIMAAEALVYLSQNNPERALEISRDALYLDPASFTALFVHARVLSAAGKPAAAENFWARSLAAEPGNPQALNLRGELCLKQGKIRDAEKWFKRAQCLDPKQSRFDEGLCRVYLLKGKLSKAQKIARRGLKNDPQNGFFAAVSGDYFKSRGQYKKAIDNYKKALSLEQGTPVLRQSFASSARNFYRELNREVDQELIDLLEEGALFFRPSDVDKERARQFMKKFTARLSSAFPPDGLLVYLLDDAVITAAEMSDERTAENSLIKSLEPLTEIDCGSKPSFDFHYSMGKIFYQFNRFAECEKVFALSLKRDGENEKAFYYLAACRELAGEFQTALNLYQKALRLNPNCELNRAGIGRMAAKIREIKDKENESNKIIPTAIGESR